VSCLIVVSEVVTQKNVQKKTQSYVDGVSVQELEISGPQQNFLRLDSRVALNLQILCR